MITGSYMNFSEFGQVKNKANQSQFKANLSQIKPNFNPKQTQSKPIQMPENSRI
jgi:hypothetical protein